MSYSVIENCIKQFKGYSIYLTTKSNIILGNNLDIALSEDMKNHIEKIYSNKELINYFSLNSAKENDTIFYDTLVLNRYNLIKKTNYDKLPDYLMQCCIPFIKTSGILLIEAIEPYQNINVQKSFYRLSKEILTLIIDLI